MKILKWLLLCLALIIAGTAALAQARLVGRVVDAADGSPVGYASILIVQQQSGSVTSEDGAFSVELPEGSYALEVRALGYEAQSVQAHVQQGGAPLSIRLRPVVHQLSPIDVVARKTGEDPAYPIMRRLMYRVPLYRRAFDAYAVQLYARSSLSVKKVPRLLNVQIGKTKVRLGDLVGKTFVEEEVSRVYYAKPDSFRQEIQARRSSIPPALKEEMSIRSQSAAVLLSGNFYGERLRGAIHTCLSPLTPGASSRYKYKLLSRSAEGDEVICRISFRSRSREVYDTSGVLEVIEGRWDVRSLTLDIERKGMVRSRVHYQLAPVGAEGVYLPTTLRSELDAKVLGMGASMSFVASMAYQDVTSAAEAKGLRDDSLASRGVSRREVERHEAELNRQSPPEGERPAGVHRYELRPTNKPAVSTDSLKPLDSTAWARVRPIPMLVAEQQSFVHLDSINSDFLKRSSGLQRRVLRAGAASGTPADEGQEEALGAGQRLTSLLFSGDLCHGKGWRLSVAPDGSPLTLPLYHYNIADGVPLGAKLGASRRVSGREVWSVRGGLSYALRRKAWLWETELRFLPSYRHNLDIRLGAGRRTDFVGVSSPSSVDRMQLALISALTGHSSVPLYERQYVDLSVSAVPTPALECAFGAGLVRSVGLDLSPVKGLIRDFIPNWGYTSAARWSDYEDLQNIAPPAYRAEYLALSGRLRWSAKPYHRRRESGWLDYSPQRRLAPIYTLEARANLPVGIGGSSFGFVKLSAEQAILLGRYAEDFIYYRVQAGGYLWRNSVAPEQAYYLKTYNSLLHTAEAYEWQFHTMPPYMQPWGRGFVTTQLGYAAPRLLVNYLPFAVNRLTTERIDLKLHYSRAVPYFELGYHWGVRGTLELGVHVGSPLFAAGLSGISTPFYAFSVRTPL